MKLNISQNNNRIFTLSLPHWLYMNSFSVSLLALRKDVPFSPKQARKSLRAVKKALHQNNLPSMGDIEITTTYSKVHIKL